MAKRQTALSLNILGVSLITGAFLIEDPRNVFSQIEKKAGGGYRDCVGAFFTGVDFVGSLASCV